jgi:putative peptidoglycan lipid II flippase
MAAMGLNAVFSFGFAALFSMIGWMPHGGLALANSLATAIEAVILLVLIRRQLGGINGAEIARGVAQFGLAALAMGLAIAFWMQTTIGLNVWVVGLGGVGLGGLVYGLGVLLLKVPEVQMLVNLIKRRVSRS